MPMSQRAPGFALALAAFTASLAIAQTPLGSAITYQGRLDQDGSPVDGLYNMVFALWDAATAGTQVGPTLTFDGLSGNPAPISVSDGLFRVVLDFGGSVYNGDARWLAIEVDGTTLAPRQELTAAPHARFSSAPWATNGSHISSVNSGNVGIRTTTPAAALDVAAGSAFQPSIVTRGGRDFGVPTNENMSFGHWDGTNLAIEMNIGPTGDVGIGTTAPANRLSVAGNANVSGSVGIGVSNPAAPLTIAATDGIALQSWHDGVGDRKWNLNLNPFGPDFPALMFSEHNVNPQSLVLRQGGNVGISTFPDLTLDVVEGAIIGNSTVNSGQHAFDNQGVKVSFGYQASGTTEFAGLRAVVSGGTAGCGNSGDIRFDTWECGTSISREVMRIAGNGRVGIGVDAPTHQLTINGGTDSLRLIGPLGSFGHGARLSFGDADYAFLQESEDDRLTMRAVAISLETAAGVIARTQFDAWGLQLHNQQQTTYQAGMRLGNDGFLYLTNRMNGASGWARLDSAGNWSVASDRSMKHEIEPLDGLLDKALALRPVSYYYNHQDLSQTPHRQVGFIAQDVEPLFPSLVLGDEKKTLNYAGLSVVAIGALQELKREKDAEIEALRAEKDAQIEKLAQRLAKLEALLTERTGN